MRCIISRKDWIRRFIINLLAHHPYGLSSWEIKKIMKLPRETIKYNLKKLQELGYIEKIGRKYVFPYEYLIKNGIIITKLVDGFVIFSCPHFGKNCKCSKKESESCRYLKELPDVLMKRFKG